MPLVERAHELAEAISSAEAAPGSGWVAGVSGSLAAALVAKVASRSEGWGGSEGARAQALDLRDRLLALAGQDARAYEQALTALERRDAGLARALDRAAEVPLAIAETAAEVTLLAAEAAEAADGAARAAVRLVEVNLSMLQEDERLGRARKAAEVASDAAGRALAVQP